MNGVAEYAVEPLRGDWFRAVTDWAAATPWLHEPMLLYTRLGLGLLGVVVVAGWLIARRGTDRAFAAALALPLAIMVTGVVNLLVKHTVREGRPCRPGAGLFLLERCPPPDNFSFPSTHTVLPMAAAGGAFLVHRALGYAALAAAALMAFSRVYVGVHYPLDVLAGALLGVTMGAVLTAAAARYGAPLVARLRPGSSAVPSPSPPPTALSPAGSADRPPRPR